MDERQHDWLAERIRADAEMSASLKGHIVAAMGRAWDAVVAARAAVARSRQTFRQIAERRSGAGGDQSCRPHVRESPESAA